MLALAGCGDGEGDGEGSSSPSGTDLKVTVWPKGPDGKSTVKTVKCDGDGPCKGATQTGIQPVEDDVACTQVFGGPATAKVEGTLQGEGVRASFDLTDGCEIDRWNRNSGILGDAPGNPPGSSG
jgi:hypothetical protein